jgi:Ca2+-dependent lipid-binding protein
MSDGLYQITNGSNEARDNVLLRKKSELQVLCRELAKPNTKGRKRKDLSEIVTLDLALKAKNLIKADTNSLSDPFVQVRLSKNKVQISPPKTKSISRINLEIKFQERKVNRTPRPTIQFKENDT